MANFRMMCTVFRMLLERLEMSRNLRVTLGNCYIARVSK